MPAPVAGVDGNWQCTACGNVNFANRDACNRCNSPKPAAAGNGWGPGGWGAAGGKSKGGKGGVPVAGVDGNWACSQCGNVNFAVREACNRCGAPKYQSAPPPQSGPPRRGGAPVAGVEGAWACTACGNVNFAARTQCNRCAAPRPEEAPMFAAAPGGHNLGMSPAGRTHAGAPIAGVDGNWECLACGNINFGHRETCNRCSAPRPDGDDANLLETLMTEPTPKQFSSGARSGGGPPSAGVDGNWACSFCNNVNFASRAACNLCGAPKHESVSDAAPVYAAAAPAPSRGPKGAPVAGVDGAWACEACGNINFALRTQCNRCQAPKPDDDFAGGELSNYGGGMAHAPPPRQQSSPRGAPVAGENGNWQCLACGNINFAVRTACNRCHAPKPQERPQAGRGGPPVAGVGGNWVCSSCQNVNLGWRDTCNRCGAPRNFAETPLPHHGGGGGIVLSKGSGKGKAPVAGVDGCWECPACGNVNFAHRDACNRCQTPKPDDEPPYKRARTDDE